MHRFDVLIVTADRETLRVRQRFLEFSGEFVDSHQETSNFDYHQNEAFYLAFKRFFGLNRNYLTFERKNRRGPIFNPVGGRRRVTHPGHLSRPGRQGHVDRLIPP
jgi:hypothetical protein